MSLLLLKLWIYFDACMFFKDKLCDEIDEEEERKKKDKSDSSDYETDEEWEEERRQQQASIEKDRVTFSLIFCCS